METSGFAHRLNALGGRVNRVVEWTCGALIAAMVVIVWLGVVTRYLPVVGLTWTEELARYVMIWAALLAVSCAAYRCEHVGLDLLPRALPPGLSKPLRIAIDVLVVLFFVFLAVYGIDMALEGRMQFSTLWGLTMEVPFAAVPVSSALAAFQFLVRLVADTAGCPRPVAQTSY